ncbi:MAG: phytoene/squalene synthase family protein [Actinomycetes bacterium]
MPNRSLAAAGISDPQLQESYELCRRLNAEHGKTYYLATLLLPKSKRPYVHALYGLARFADDIVDSTDHITVSQRERALDDFAARFFADLDAGSSTDPVAAATIDTALRWQIPREHFEAFFTSMRMDLTVDHYDSYQDLYTYVYGSAAVIGLQMVPILEPSSPLANTYATELGVAFQLANFIRDVGEDLDRGRIYLPLDELAQFGVTAADLQRRVVTESIKDALAFQVQRVHALERSSRPGIEMLRPDCQPCINAARILYCQIADEVVKNDYDVFNSRARVPVRRRLRVAGSAWRQARRARSRGPADS